MLNIVLFEIWGSLSKPEPLRNFADVESGGIGQIINLFINILVVGAGIYAVINFILAGYAFMSAGGDSQKIAGAWAKIWQSVLGLTVAAGALVLAALFGKLIFGPDYNILKPFIPGL